MFELNELIKAVSGKLVGAYKGRAVKGVSIDTRTLTHGQAFIAVKGENFDGHCFINEAIKKGASCLIVKKAPDRRKAPLAPVSFIEVADTVKALGDIARSLREKFNTPVIAVTGSNGKTTAKEMIAWVLSGSFRVLKNEGTKNNHIGLPLTLLGLDSAHDFAVLELGSNHPGEIANLARICSPNMSVITNIGQSHLEAFKNLRGVFREKISLLRHLKSPGIAVLNGDNAFLSKAAGPGVHKPAIFTYGLNRPADFFADSVELKDWRLRFVVNKKYKFSLKTPGLFNAYNALAAITVGRLAGLNYRDIAGRLDSFVFPRGRLNLIECGSVKFIDDTYNSNPNSLEQALRTLSGIRVKGRKIFVMGDMLELGQSQELFHRRAQVAIARSCDALIGVGELSIAAAAKERKSGLERANIFTCDNAAEARDILFNRICAGEGDIVLVKGSRSMKMEEVFR